MYTHMYLLDVFTFSQLDFLLSDHSATVTRRCNRSGVYHVFATQELHGLATSHDAVLVLHGASGLATDLVKVM